LALPAGAVPFRFMPKQSANRFARRLQHQIPDSVSVFPDFYIKGKQESSGFYVLPRRMLVTSCPSRKNGKVKGDVFVRNTSSSMQPPMFFASQFPATQDCLSATGCEAFPLQGNAGTAKRFHHDPD
jgi:hypothetical protein